MSMSNKPNGYPPQVRLGQLYERTSKATGNVYLSGRIGLARIVIVKSREMATDGTAIWDILLSQAPPKAASAGPPLARRTEPDGSQLPLSDEPA